MRPRDEFNLPMPIHLTDIVEAYGAFENQVRRWTENQCRPFCTSCRAVCCRAHFCDESRQSVFLARVIERWSSRSVYDPATGWLTRTGCGLSAGRPPVCYEFLCRGITLGLATNPLRHHALLAASMLMTHVGRRAVGHRHLVTLVRHRDLERVRPGRLLARLEEAHAAFAVIEDRFAGRVPRQAADVLERIVAAPAAWTGPIDQRISKTAPA